MTEATKAGGVPAADRARLARRMLIIATLCQNVAIGLTFGSYGALVVAIERTMHVDRGLSALGAALATLVLSLMSPSLGMLIGRFGIKRVLIAGAMFTALGYVAAAAATGIVGLLCAYALLVGPGIALLGIAAPSSLVANWFDEGRGRAIGIVNMPIVVAVLPPISALLVRQLGLQATLLVLAGMAALLVPLLFGVRDTPAAAGFAKTEPDADHAGHGTAGASKLLRVGDYWFLSLAAAIIAAGGATMATHVIAMSIGQGVEPARAALLLSVLGASGILGSLGYGMLADRIGGARALSVNALFQLVLWMGMLVLLPFPARALLVFLIGVNSGGAIASIGTALSQRFGPAALGGALDLWSLLSLPFTVGMPPLTGALFARTGSYVLPFLTQIALFAVAALLPWLCTKAGRRNALPDKTREPASVPM